MSLIDQLRARRMFLLNGSTWVQGVSSDDLCQEVANELEAVTKALAAVTDLRPDGTLADQISNLDDHRKKWKGLFFDMCERHNPRAEEVIAEGDRILNERSRFLSTNQAAERNTVAIDPTPKEDACSVVALRPATASAGDAPAGSSAGTVDDEAGPSLDQLPASFGSLAPEFGDPETLFNSRDWLRAALEAKGAKITGGGVGLGQADLDFELEGCKFNVSLAPR